MAPDLFFLSALSALFFASGIVLSQFGLRHLSPLAGASISVPTSAALFVLASPVTVDWENWHMPSVLIFALAGLFYPAAVTLLNFVSNRRLGADLTAAMGNLTPLFAIALAVILLGELPGLGQSIGIAIVFAGLFLIASARARTHPTASLLLLLIPVAGAFLRGGAQPFVKIGLLNWPNAFAAATISYIMSASVVWVVRAVAPPQRPGFSWVGFGWFTTIGVANGLALLTLYAALTMGPVPVVAPVVATYPLITYVMNRLIFRDRAVSVRGLWGIALSVLGVMLVLAN